MPKRMVPAALLRSRLPATKRRFSTLQVVQPQLRHHQAQPRGWSSLAAEAVAGPTLQAASRPSVPLIDLSRPPELTAIDVHAACLTTGFFQIVGHGVPERLRARMLSEAESFFALPQEAKDDLSIWKSADKVRGYQRMHENITQGAADWHEGLDLYAESPHATQHLGKNPWPVEQPSLRTAIEAYVHEMQRVGGLVTSLMARSLGLPPETFEPFYDDGFWCLRAIHYPPKGEAASQAAPDLGCGMHTDYGCLTLLHTDDTPGALQVQTTDGAWLGVEPTPGAFTCNIGSAAGQKREGARGRLGAAAGPPASARAHVAPPSRPLPPRRHDGSLDQRPLPRDASPRAPTCGDLEDLGTLLLRAQLQGGDLSPAAMLRAHGAGPAVAFRGLWRPPVREDEPELFPCPVTLCLSYAAQRLAKSGNNLVVFSGVLGGVLLVIDEGGLRRRGKGPGISLKKTVNA